MDKKVRNPIPIFTTRATAIVSVALVLLIVGLGVMTGLGARRAASSVRDSMGFVVILSDEVTAGEINAITEPIKKRGALREVRFSTADDVLTRWQKMLGDEDIVRMAGVNPFHPELEVFLTPPYASSDSIDRLANMVSVMPMVEDVEVNTRMMAKITHTLGTVRVILLVVAGALLLVSFVLIFNTVRLSVYANRFLINTMQLVGATPGFVRRPFLTANLVNGLIAGFIASALIFGGYFYLVSIDASFAALADTTTLIILCCGLVATGMVICFIAAFFAANRYLRQSYDNLFRQ